ncbi:thymic stromal lymphopoietin [Balaenoptera acutorostrata]|uniref:Thymic stromal lymphopoietin n=1 Tax=Balaenoptera acutorostrata TaxID=9767 RepID=A0ABM3T2M3_BALAC|nr:thymic stromal lymphopoietin [Balaenoptera acutorostrata]
MAGGVGDPCPRRMQVEPGQKLLSSAPALSEYPNPVKKSVSQDSVRLPNLQLPIRNTSHVIADESGFDIIPQDPEKVCEGKSKPAISLLLPSLKQVPELRPQLTEIVEATRGGAKAKRRDAGRTNCASLRASCALDSTWPRVLRCPLRRAHIRAHIKGLGQRQKEEVFFRKIFILQLVELVLTYNFTDCDFKKIKDIYQDVIHPELNIYINGTKSIWFNKFVYCEDAPDCLIKIEHFTFKPIYGCVSLAKETFAQQTNATLSLECSGYSGIQVNRCIRRSHFNILELTLNSSRASVQSCDFYSGSVFRRASERVKPVDCRLVPH